MVVLGSLKGGRVHGVAPLERAYPAAHTLDGRDGGSASAQFRGSATNRQVVRGMPISAFFAQLMDEAFQRDGIERGCCRHARRRGDLPVQPARRAASRRPSLSTKPSGVLSRFRGRPPE